MVERKPIERGQSITFRIPSDTPDYLLKQLQKLKETERRNFSSEIAQFVLKGVNETVARERETVTIPLPKQLTKEQKSWLKHEHSEALVGSILYQLLQDPTRTTSILATLNRYPSVGDEALYVQDDVAGQPMTDVEQSERVTDDAITPEVDIDDLGAVTMDALQDEDAEEAETEEVEESNPLGDFFSRMNRSF